MIRPAIAQFPDPNTGRFESVRTLHESVDVLKPSDVVERYKEIVGHYAKYRQVWTLKPYISLFALIWKQKAIDVPTSRYKIALFLSF